MIKGLYVPNLSNYEDDNEGSIGYNLDAIADVIANIKKKLDSLDIDVNTTNAAAIAENIANIASNAAAIAVNVAAISLNIANTAANTANIATNISDISDNTTDIGTKVTGVSSSTDNALVRFDSTTGKLIQDGKTIEDDNGNIGVKSTPNTWTASYAAIQVNKNACLYGDGGNLATLTSNLYFDSGYKYITSNPATYYRQQNGSHIWASGVSGTPGVTASMAISMIIGASGYLRLLKIQSGATQAAAGAAASELWKTSGHATLPDNVVMIGV